MAPVLRALDFPAACAADHGDAIAALTRGELGAALVRALYRPEEAACVASRIEEEDLGFPRSSFPPEFHAHFLGQCLDLAGAALDGYFAQVEALRAATRRAFRGLPDFEATLLGVVAALGGGRPVAVPRGPRGESYVPFTYRLLGPGGFIPPHCEAEQSRRPPYRHLAGVIDPAHILSVYLVLQAPEAGGELGVSPLRFHDVDPRDMQNQRTNVAHVIRDLPSEAFAPAAGDLIVFDGGSHIHWVAPVAGRRTRWTVGGFVAPARDGETLWVWS